LHRDDDQREVAVQDPDVGDAQPMFYYRLGYHQRRPKYFIHQCLVYGRSISEDKGHDQILIVAIMRAESCFRDIIVMNLNLVIPRMKIQLGEKMSSMKLINNRNQKLILDCDVIKFSEVNVEAP